MEGIQFWTIDRTTQLTDDFTLFIQDSHTPGVIGLILKTENNGTIITTSDAVYTRKSYEQRIAPGGDINKTADEFFDNLAVLKKLREKHEGATLFFGHDYDQVMDYVARGTID